jgi:signal transduction histidine kinase
MALSPSAPAIFSADKDRFATTVHELRPPLTTISGVLDELVEASRATSRAVPTETVAFDLRGAVTEAIAQHETGDEARVTPDRLGVSR